MASNSYCSTDLVAGGSDNFPNNMVYRRPKDAVGWGNQQSKVLAPDAPQPSQADFFECRAYDWAVWRYAPD